LSDQPKKPEGGAEDLLSKLFEMDSASGAAPSDVNFGESTRIEENPSGAASARPSSRPPSSTAPKQSIDDLLKVELGPDQDSRGAENTNVGDGDNLFDGILEEDPGASEKVNIFSSTNAATKVDPNQETGLSEVTHDTSSPSQNPFSSETRNKTILLESDSDLGDSAVSEGTKPQIQDPIDEALSQYAAPEEVHDATEEIRKPPQKMASQPSRPSSVKMESVSAGDFAEGFVSDAVQVPDVRSLSKTVWKSKATKWGGLGIGLVAGLAVLVLGFVRLQSDRGLFGYRTEGFSLVKAYRPPTEAQQKEFEPYFQAAFEARQSDDPKRIEEALPKLKNIVSVDERNLAAVTFALEHTALLMTWYGIKSSWPQQYDEWIQKYTQILEKVSDAPVLPAFERAKAWRSLALGETARAYSDLTGAMSQLRSVDDETYGLLIELAVVTGNKSEATAWMSKLTRKPGTRVKHFQALMNEDLVVISELASSGYLPSKIEEFVRQTIRKESAEKLLARVDSLLEEAKNFPPYVLRLREYRGDLYSFLGDGSRAREEWSLVVERFPKNGSTWIKLAKSYEEDALWDEAILAYQSALKAKSLNEEGTLRFAQLLRVRGKILDAVSIIDEALKTNAKSAQLYYERGMIQATIFQIDAAKSAFLKALELDSKLEMATIGLANLAVQQKQWVEAEGLLGKIPPESPLHSEALLALAHIDKTKLQFNEAEKHLARAIQESPKLESAYPELVDLYLLDERDEKAANLVKAGLDVLPRSPLLKVSMARVYQFRGQFDKALMELESVRKSFGHLPEVIYAVADILIDSKEISQAYDIINPMLEKTPKDPELIYLKAKAFHRDSDQSRGLGSNEAAYRSIETAIQLSAEKPHFHILAAQIALLLQDKNSAIEHLESVLKMNSHHPKALLIRGDIYRDTGDYDHATQTYLEVLKYTRFQGPIFGRLADGYKAQGKSAEAIKYYTKVVETNPSDAHSQLELGKLYSDEGRYINSLRYLSTAVKLNPTVAETYYFLGFVNKELGKRKDAIQAFEKFLSMEPSGTEASTVRDEIYFLKGRSSQD
jgi:tetratricopeptide (TPR) repeat protein